MKIFTYIALFTTLISCGKSPLFNHKKEGEQPKGTSISFVSAMELKVIKKYVQINWINTPKGDPSIESQFLILVKDNTGKLVDLDDNTSFSVWGWMPSMGHGTADDGYTTRISKGIYHHRELFFNMGGDWELNFDVMRNTALIDSTTTSLSL